ncbi:MAG TPA: protein translocase subunit SecD [Thermoleophilia bacterium]|nr:protein translocase subunit SecD [Thermoleophilia bacterium]HZK48226.1 protein translocase subunit SecD [Thermoleophilia bacterium]
MQRNVVILAVVAVLLCVAAYFIYPPGSSTRLGLDLQGGLAVILEAQDSARAPRTDDGMKQTISIINDRINRLGVTEPEVQRQGEWKISVQLPGIENKQEALAIIGKTAVLEFYDVKDFGAAYASEAEALKAAGVDSEAQLPADTRLVRRPSRDGTLPDRFYIVTAIPAVTGTGLSGASVGFDNNNQPKIDMQFKSDGAQAFAEVTQALADRAQVTGQDQLLAIVLDGVVQSAPRVAERIDGGRAEITGRFTLDEAKNLVLVLQTGALPIELKVIDERSIGATLGKASLTQALWAGVVGLILVAVFMVAYYRLLGLVADLTLLIYGVLFWGILNSIHATLTLPGIAGMILTLGMAVDANVIIFARIREEVHAGKTVRTAVEAGFRKALSAILDANVTTLITAVVLFWAASGGVRGFALTLGIGVALSMFTAIVVTRALLALLSGLKIFKNPTLTGLSVETER